jgi:hypothetical protein
MEGHNSKAGTTRMDWHGSSKGQANQGAGKKKKRYAKLDRRRVHMHWLFATILLQITPDVAALPT